MTKISEKREYSLSAIKNFVKLAKQLQESISFKEKLHILQKEIQVQKFIKKNSHWKHLIEELDVEEQVIAYSVIAIGQGTRIFFQGDMQKLQELTEQLLPVEKFYQFIGGIVGYQAQVLQLLHAKGVGEKRGIYHQPKAIDITKCNPFVSKAILWGIKHLDQIVEMYPLGGAADRLSLRNEVTGRLLPAARLEFCGKSLIEHLIIDLQAREYLHYKLFNKQIHIPVAMMTSGEKDNDILVRALFKEKEYFGKPKKDFLIFAQPLVPVMNKKGEWCVLGPMQVLLKPGGHGAIWKLASDLGILYSFLKQGKKKAIIRQINNLVASTDYGLLAFAGFGLKQNYEFGFAACPRPQGIKEGVNLVIEKDAQFCLTNIEYCDLKRFRVDEGVQLLSNTNILFVDLKTLKELIVLNPIPGMLINAKKIKYIDSKENVCEEEILRLESTMQNIADALIEEGNASELKRSFITFNHRKKTISAIKQEFAFGSSMQQTPERCYLDMLENARELLVHYCDVEVPALHDEVNFFIHGPSFIFLYHPALGPLYSIIAQKIKHGRLAMGSEMNLEIADLFMENFDVDGCLSIQTEAIMGHRNENGVIEFSKETGKCILKNVRIRNAGINREASHAFWKNEIIRRECCEIFIEEGGEFFAENVVFKGNLRIRVPSGVRVCAVMHEGQVHFTQTVLKQASWHWHYSTNNKSQITLQMEKNLEEPQIS